ncbi:ABC transporter permease [Sporosarcina sp. FSL W7-1349]|uniref:ABC transporter permease n=1 Tax=Bacillales TaxID=1385 RepID=UPI00058206B2|nr:ABC transporter permease [Bacillus sp. OxB-1]BAQ10148.1 ABC-type multidrug transport system, permease component [Bacillus sp. OxB-1]
MRILWNEMKKILTWKAMLLLFLVNSVLYFLLIEFHIEHFPNGRPALDSYRLGVEMIEKYGTDMDAEEIIDFKNEYDARVEEADQYLQARQEFVEAGLDTYDKLINHDWDNQEQSDLQNRIFHEEQVDLFWELQDRRRLVEFHESKDVIPDNLSSEQIQRMEKLFAAGKFQVYTEIVMENFRTFIGNVAIAILFSVVLVISPVILKDRMRQIVPLQYTTKKGRNLYRTKIVAGLLSAFLVITGLLAVYFGIYSLNNTSPFFDVRVNTFIGPESWYDPTFFQYIVLCAAAIYAIGLISALLAMASSTVVPNFVSLIGVQIPIIAGMLIVGLKPMLHFIIAILYPQWLVPLAYVALVVVSVVVVWRLWRGEGKRDIVL